MNTLFEISELIIDAIKKAETICTCEKLYLLNHHIAAINSAKDKNDKQLLGNVVYTIMAFWHVTNILPDGTYSHKIDFDNIDELTNELLNYLRKIIDQLIVQDAKEQGNENFLDWYSNGEASGLEKYVFSKLT